MRLVLLLVIVLVAVVCVAVPAVHAQVTLCTASGFSVARGSTACNGASNPLAVTATVKTYARLALDEVFGSPAASLRVAMGEIDANCVSPAAAGIRCVADTTSGVATWFGDLRFHVTLVGLGLTRAKLTGLRPTSGTIPDGRLLDGAGGTLPTVSYPRSPASPADLQTSLGNGDTTVTRSLGLKVTSSDPAAVWSGNAVFSLVLE